MVGHTRKSDVKSRLGKRKPAPNKAVKSGRVRDARDILRKKVPAKSKAVAPDSQSTSLNTKDRVRRLMPLGDILSGHKKKSATSRTGSKDKRTLSMTSGSLRITTKQLELCRRTIVSKDSLKIVTPSKTISGSDSAPSSSTGTTTRTLKNDLFTRERRSPLDSVIDTADKDLRTSSPNLSRTTEYKPMGLRTPLTTQRQDMTQKNLTKIVVTNLHPRVVQEDIAELFGAVGPLINVKLEQCVAEVIFAKAEDADVAYQKYHNRMLDGQAMKCTLGLANTPDQAPIQSSSTEALRSESLATKGIRMNYTGADLVYPKTPSRPVVFQVQI